MPEYTLTARPALDGYQETFDGTTLEEVTGLALVSIAVPLGGTDALDKALQGAYGVSAPKAGECRITEDGNTRFLGLAADQFFAVLADSDGDAVATVADRLGNAGYYTLQSDNWVALRLSGPLTRTALERICPLDLDPGAFPQGKVARTAMEHMGVILYPDGPDAFVLLSASSSAASFLHAVETSIHNAS